MKAFADKAVESAFESYPESIRMRLMEVRSIIFDCASEMPGVGTINECLKWGEPAYLTSETKSGSTIRLGLVRGQADKYALFFNCQTSLVETFRSQFAEVFDFEGNRAVVLDVKDEIPAEAVSHCVRDALTYHLRKKVQR